MLARPGWTNDGGMEYLLGLLVKRWGVATTMLVVAVSFALWWVRSAASLVGLLKKINPMRGPRRGPPRMPSIRTVPRGARGIGRWVEGSLGEALPQRIPFPYLRRRNGLASRCAVTRSYPLLFLSLPPVDFSTAEGHRCKDMKPSKLRLPALNTSLACPGLTPATSFPAAASDYYQLDELLAPEEKDLRIKVRQFMEKEVAPIIPKCWEKAEFPFHIIPKLASLGFGGGIIKGYGCPGLSGTACAMWMSEMSRVDASIASFCLVQSCLVMLSIVQLGSKEQKEKYLPPLSKMHKVCVYALSEPDHGSDASSLITTARKVPGGWVINGQKRWPANSSFADLFLVLARNTSTNQINGFIVNGGSPGMKISKIENKVSLRIVQNCDILLEEVFVPDDHRLPGANTFQDLVNRCLSRVSWSPGLASALLWGRTTRAYGTYVGERKQFGVPLAAFQLNQEKLVRMLGNIQAMSLLGWRLYKLHDSGNMTVGQASLGKAWITLRARETLALGRELLGGNGIVTDFHVGKAFCDMESVYSYEGSYEVNALIVAREITGISSIRPAAAALSKASRL